MKLSIIKELLKNISLEKFAQFLLLATALTPLIRTDFSLFPYVFGKAFYFFGLVSLAGICIGVSFLIKPQMRFEEMHLRLIPLKFNKAFLLFGLYLMSLLISTILSKNSYVSFWGTFDRLEGFFQLMMYSIFAFFAAISFDKKHWVAYAKVSMVTVMVLCVTAWLQRIGIPFSLPFVLVQTSQPGSLIGSSTFLASYLIIAGSFIATQIGLGDSKNLFFRSLIAFFYIVLFSTVIITGTKGAFLGLCGGVIIYLCSAVASKKSSLYWRAGAVALLLCGIITVGIFVATRHNPLWLNIPTVKRFASLTSNSNTIQSRLLAWDAAVQGFKQRWAFGWGTEEFGRVFNTYGSPKMARYSDGWFDRPHNKYLEVLVCQGIIGLSTYLIVIWLILSALRHKPIALSLFVAYLIQNFFIFDTIVSYPIFVLFLAMAAQKTSHAKRATFKQLTIGRVLAALLIIGSLYVIVSNVIVFKQQIAFHKFVSARDSDARLAQLNELLYPINPTQTKVRMQLLEFFLTALKPNNAKDMETFLKAAQSMEEVLQYGDGDPRYAVDLAEAYYYLRFSGRNFIGKAEAYAESVLRETPRAPKGYYLFILMSIDSKRFDLAIDYARQAAALDKGNARAQMYLALSLISAGDSSVNPYYYSGDKKFDQWLNEGREVLRTAYSLASRRRDGSIAVTDIDFSDTQFRLFNGDEIQNMFFLAHKLNEVEIVEKLKRVSDVYNVVLPIELN